MGLPTSCTMQKGSALSPVCRWAATNLHDEPTNQSMGLFAGLSVANQRNRSIIGRCGRAARWRIRGDLDDPLPCPRGRCSALGGGLASILRGTSGGLDKQSFH